MGMRLKTSPQLFVWHDKRPTPLGLFRQMRRFAEGRVQLSRKMPDTLRPLHRLMGWSVPLASLVAAGAVATLPTWVILVVVLGAWLLLASTALADRETLGAAVLVAPAMAIVMLGWSYGYLKERFFPMASTVGR
jgi:cellulose synthase/poly-beta-1,6-N-acetylglucosamine synthase-like glycosyltransferase